MQKFGDERRQRDADELQEAAPLAVALVLVVAVVVFGVVGVRLADRDGGGGGFHRHYLSPAGEVFRCSLRVGGAR